MKILRWGVLTGITALLLQGCISADQKTRPFLGMWVGKFIVSNVGAGPNTPDDHRRHTLTGYIRVLLDKKAYQMHLEGEQQKVDIKGEWAYKGNQLILSPKDVQVVDESDDGPNPNRKYVDAEELTIGYRQKLTFNINKAANQYTAPEMKIAFLTGTHSFKKE
jgi:hypothetical protein